MRILLKSTGGSLRLGDETGMIVGYVGGNRRASEVKYDADTKNKKCNEGTT
jgi:hypothetical protein